MDVAIEAGKAGGHVGYFLYQRHSYRLGSTHTDGASILGTWGEKVRRSGGSFLVYRATSPAYLYPCASLGLAGGSTNSRRTSKVCVGVFVCVFVCVDVCVLVSVCVLVGV